MTIGFATWMGRLRVAVRPFASCTWKIKGNGKNVWVLDLPVGAFKVEGVPEIAPFMEFNVRPDGSFSRAPLSRDVPLCPAQLQRWRLAFETAARPRGNNNNRWRYCEGEVGVVKAKNQTVEDIYRLV